MNLGNTHSALISRQPSGIPNITERSASAGAPGTMQRSSAEVSEIEREVNRHKRY